MKNIFVLSLLLISCIGYGQQPDLDWQKSLGGSENDLIFSMQQTADDGYIVVGDSYSVDGDITGNHGNWDYWVVKLDLAGNITWQKSLGGSGSDYANSIQQTTDGGYIVAGFSFSNDGDVTGNHGGDDFWVVKLDAAGNINWENSLGGSGLDYAESIQQTSDGGYVVVGGSDSNDGDVTGNHGRKDCWVVKMDASGTIMWQKSLGGSLADSGYSIQQTSDGGYIIAGESESSDGDVTGNNGNKDNWIVKLDASGNITWQQSLGGSNHDSAKSIQQTTDGGYIVTGWSNSNDGDITGNHANYDYWIVKLNATGNITWQKSLGGNGEDRAYSIRQTSDGGYLVAGESRSIDGNVTGNNGNKDCWIVKLDAVGNITWQQSLGGSGNDSAYSVQQTTNGGYIVAGGASSYDGDVTGNNGKSDFWIVKLSSETSSIDENKTLKFSLYPNPTEKTFKISSDQVINSAFQLIDSQGKKVLSGNMNGKEQIIDISELSKGVYAVVFDDAELPVLNVIKE